MKISYSNKKLEKQLTNPGFRKKTYGKLATNIFIRLSELTVADTLDDISPNPPPRRHKMTGEKATWSLDVSRNYRMWIRSVNGAEDPLEVNEVEIIDIIDDH